MELVNCLYNQTAGCASLTIEQMVISRFPDLAAKPQSKSAMLWNLVGAEPFQPILR
jgi:hypothetical protein